MVYLCSKSKMYKAKYFKTLIVILLFWKITLCNSNSTQSNLKKNIQIFYGGKIVSIRSLTQQNEMHSSTDTYQHLNVFYTSKKCMYADIIVNLLQTFFEIFVYGANSHTEIYIPNIKDYTKNWLISAIYHFNNIKPPIVKIIDDLLLNSDNIKILKTSDQNLLKSLLTINLFLYNSVKNSPFIVYTEITTNDQDEFVYTINDNDFYKTIKNIRGLNSSIIQMIGLVERFRSKRCVVSDPYKYNFVNNEKFKDILIHDVDNIRKLLHPFLYRLNILVNNGSDNYNSYNSNIYDPEYLLFEKLLDNITSFFGNVQIHFNGRLSDLISIYNYAKDSYSIEHILEFQHILIKVIADIFYFQIHNLSRDIQHGITYLNDLLLSFKEYTYKMMPSNCSIIVCNKILKAQVYLKKVLLSYNYSIELDVLRKLENRFVPENNIELIYHNTFQDFDDPSLSFLFHNMWSEKQYESFRSVINLLSHESYSNSDFYIVKVPDHEEFTSQTYDPKFIKSMIELQHALFAFWTLLKMENNYQVSIDIIHYSIVNVSDLSAIGFTTPGNDNVKKKKYVSKMKCRECEEYGTLFADILRVIVNFYNSSDDYPAVRNILLPLLIHLKQTDKYSHQLSDYDLSMMLQTTFLTITIVENYLIKNYSFTFYSLFVYSKFVMNDSNGPDLIKLRHDLQTYAETSTISFKNALDFLNFLYDVNSYNTLFPEDDKHLKFFWNGSEQFGHDIFQNVIKGISDINDFISLQWFSAKWVMSKILMKLMNALALLRYYARKLQRFSIINNKLNEFLLLEFPMPIKIFLDDVFNATLATLNIDWNDFNSNTFQQCEIVVYSGLTALDAHISNNEPHCPEIETIMSDINSEIEKLKNIVVLHFLGMQNILVSTDLCLSPVKMEFSDEIIELLNLVD